ncbi:MAG TPA: glutathione S-transferase N-terminal domain-containing protein [Arenibaculum sp.]|nr:glutathione S-transferase N-terminal domain-containing protein [Arenibaculum sp.]
MITLYTYPTPNGQKASIMLEELGLDYQARRVSLASGENLKPPFLSISPIGKIPALIEEDGGTTQRIFGSGAILTYLADKHGRLLPSDPAQRAEALSWLTLGIGDLASAAGSLFRFAVMASEKSPYAIEHFSGEIERCWKALNTRLGNAEYLAGPEYSIADIANYTFTHASTQADSSLFQRFPNMKRWYDAVAARPAVERGMRVTG